MPAPVNTKITFTVEMTLPEAEEIQVASRDGSLHPQYRSIDGNQYLNLSKFRGWEKIDRAITDAIGAQRKLSQAKKNPATVAA